MSKRNTENNPGKPGWLKWIFGFGFIFSFLTLITRKKKSATPKPASPPVPTLPVVATRTVAADPSGIAQNGKPVNPPKPTGIYKLLGGGNLIAFMLIVGIYIGVRWSIRKVSSLHEYMSKSISTSPETPVSQEIANPSFPWTGLWIVEIIFLIALFIWLYKRVGKKRTAGYAGLTIIGILAVFFLTDLAVTFLFQNQESITQYWLTSYRFLAQRPLWIVAGLAGICLVSLALIDLWKNPTRSLKRLVKICVLILLIFLVGPMIWEKFRNWDSSRQIPQKAFIQNPVWVTARPDAYSEEVLIPYGYSFSCTAVPKDRKFQFIPNNDLTAAISLDGSPGEAHIPTDTRSIRVRSLEKEPVVVQVMFTVMK